MVGTHTLILAATLSCLACTSGDKDATDSAKVAGAYVHTYTADVIDPQTAEVMGTRTVRDTIYVKNSGDNYEISNHKWVYNDYENDGWVTTMPEADKPMPTYLTKYDPAMKKLIPAEPDKYPPLYFDDEKIYWGEEKALVYAKVDD